jgi:hypothetical protein
MTDREMLQEAAKAITLQINQIEQGYIAHGLPFTSFQEQASRTARATLERINKHLEKEHE